MPITPISHSTPQAVQSSASDPLEQSTATSLAATFQRASNSQLSPDGSIKRLTLACSSALGKPILGLQGARGVTPLNEGDFSDQPSMDGGQSHSASLLCSLPVSLPIICTVPLTNYPRNMPGLSIGKNGEIFSDKYRPEYDGLYPVRKHGLPVLIENIAEWSLSEMYERSAIEPFVSPFITPAERGELYSQNLKVEKFTEKDLSSIAGERVCEMKLIGQDKVVAVRYIPKGTCVGVYAGELSDEKHGNVSYVVEATREQGKYLHIFGDNILSRANSTFRFNAIDKTYQQVVGGYALESIGFVVTVSSRPLLLCGLFTTRDISAGEELRWNYGYTPEAIKYVLHNKSRDGRIVLF